MTTRPRPFEIPGHVTIAAGRGDLPCVQVRTDWSEATIYLHGAHLAAFGLRGQAPVLFLSERSRFAPGQAIRGGVPVIFPWFGNRDGAPAHGFARTSAWTLAAAERRDDGRVVIVLELNAAPPAVPWPSFVVRSTIIIGPELAMTLAVENRAPEPIAVELCLHTYLHVGDLAQVAIAGLEDTEYVDKVDGFRSKCDRTPLLRFDGPTDRVYGIAPQPVAIDDPVLGRRIVVTKRDAPSTVVWNPGAETSRTMSDLEPDDWRRFVCVESGAVGAGALTLAPGARHEMAATLAVAG